VRPATKAPAEKRETRPRLKKMERQRAYTDNRSVRPASWQRLARAADTPPDERSGAEIAVIDEFVASCPLAVMPVDAPNLRIRLATLVSCRSFRKGSVILAPHRAKAAWVYVIHSGTVALTGMPIAAQRARSFSMEETKRDEEMYGKGDGALHKIGAGSVFGMCGRPTVAGAALAHTDVDVVCFSRDSLRGAVESMYLEINRMNSRHKYEQLASASVGGGNEAQPAPGLDHATVPKQKETHVDPELAADLTLAQTAGGAISSMNASLQAFSVFSTWDEAALTELSWFSQVAVAKPGQFVQPPPAFRNKRCIAFVISGDVQMKLGERLSHVIQEKQFWGESALNGEQSIMDSEKSGLARFAKVVRRTTQ
jgi:hypothetical protein